MLAAVLALETLIVNARLNNRSVLSLLALSAVSACSGGASVPAEAAAPRALEASVDVVVRTDAAADVPRDVLPSFTPPTQIVALGGWVPIRRQPNRNAPLAGYLRGGAITRVVGYPVGRDTCPVRRDHPEGGWYRLEGGGFICVGGALAVPWPSRDVARPTQPMLDAGLPYRIAIVYGRAFLYHAPPTPEIIRQFEARPAPDAGPEGEGSGETPDNGSANTASSTTTTAAEPTGEPRLSDLRGERGSPVIRRLLTGMYLGLDRTVRNRATGDIYWRTTTGGYVRSGPLSMLDDWSTFTGIELADGRALPYAFMVSLNGFSYRVSANGRSVSYHRNVPRLTAFQLTNDPPIEQGESTYVRTTDGLALRSTAVRIARLRPPPTGVGPEEKWIDVDLQQQILTLYEGPRPVYVTLVSTGRRSHRRGNHDYATPAGSFRIRSKHITTTMDGDTAADGPYSIEDVPWAMYFHESYALHGAFWHGNFGWRMSHGCVNLAPNDARRVFLWSEPALPEGWHGVFSTEQVQGTRVELHHGDEPTPRRPVFRD